MPDNDNEDFEGMGEYDEGRDPEPSDEDALDWGEDYTGCSLDGVDWDDMADYDDED